jgi:hypothetical protein
MTRSVMTPRPRSQARHAGSIHTARARRSRPPVVPARLVEYPTATQHFFEGDDTPRTALFGARVGLGGRSIAHLVSFQRSATVIPWPAG